MSIAIHEIAHAVGHLEQGLYVRRVTLNPGYCDHGQLVVESLTADELFRHAVAALCGREAERIICGVFCHGGQGDEADAAMLAGFATGDAAPWVARARECAVALVHDHAAGIILLADALIACGELDARQLHRTWFAIQHPQEAALIADRECRAAGSRRARLRY